MEHLHVFLSSPGDVSHERQLALKVIEQIQSERLYRDRIKLEVVAWDKPGAGTAMSAHLEPQEAIDRGLKKPSECDIVIVIFWARMGTPLSEKHLKPDGGCYRSGTEYEFLDGLNAAKKADKPDVLVYRRKNPPDVNLADPKRKEKEKQWDLVEEFFTEFRNPDDSYRIYSQEYMEPSDFKDLLEQDLRDLITKYFQAHPPDKVEDPDTIQEPIWEESPFPGLRTFTAEEALIFYGRGRETDQLICKLSDPQCRFLAVVGASGTGKSSLAAAGLLPALEKDAIPGSKDWIRLRIIPGEVGKNPFMALAIAFKPIIERHGYRPRDMAKKLETDPKELNKFLSMALERKPEWAKLLLLIDQFEELFTLVKPKYQSAFIDLLGVASKTARLRQMITMRADFYNRCLEWPVLDELLAGGLYTLLTPKTGALHEMIIRPAELAGLQFEGGLTNRILDDTGTGPGALALMAFALYELWKKSEGTGGLLTHSAYKSFNGVHGAIGKRAEETYRKHLEEAGSETTLSSVFRELVEVDERGVPTRRRARTRQFSEDKAAASLVANLTDSRLLVTSEAEDNEPMVEVAHEAIFTHWHRLKEWIEIRHDDLRLLRQVRLAAAEWEKEGFLHHFLWPHERLVLVTQMVERMRPKLKPHEKEFVCPESERLLKEIDDKATTHQERAKIGDRLAEIGDPRPGVGLRKDGLPDIEWCKVPGGELTLEEGTGTFSIEPFLMSKYPVTWIQFRSFIEAKDGYQNKNWWRRLAIRKEEPGEQYRKLDNHPAENVSWYDAVAFCRWLSKQINYEIRLPTELEWQQAATGGDPRNIYPWGAKWDPDRANTTESGLSRSTAVGLYPQGASLVETFDMSGNLWEWCLNVHDNPQWVKERGKHLRAVRGGCWNYPKFKAHCAYRGHTHYSPESRSYRLGFRLRCTAPIP